VRREAAKEFLRRGVRPQISSAASKIICISSVHEIIPWAGHVNYAASKGGINMMMQSIAQELAPHKIRVNSIAPGAIKTPINKSAWDTPQAEAKLLQLIPAKRVGDVEDIAKAAVWLASDDSDYVWYNTFCRWWYDVVSRIYRQWLKVIGNCQIFLWALSSLLQKSFI